jgi:hypothetical protein
VRIWLINGVLGGHVTRAVRRPGVVSLRGGAYAPPRRPAHPPPPAPADQALRRAPHAPPAPRVPAAPPRRLDPYINREA